MTDVRLNATTPTAPAAWITEERSVFDCNDDETSNSWSWRCEALENLAHDSPPDLRQAAVDRGIIRGHVATFGGG